jgi:peptidoglycan hydrolase CwlO-like protein
MKKWLLYTLVIVLVAATAANTCLLIQQRNKDGDLEFKLAELNSNLSSVQSDLTALQGEITSLAGVGQKAAGDILAINTTVDQLAVSLKRWKEQQQPSKPK